MLSYCLKCRRNTESKNEKFAKTKKGKFGLRSSELATLQLGSSKNFWKGLVIVKNFLSFKGTTHAYLLYMSIAPNILSLKDKYTCRFSNFLINQTKYR